MAARSIAGGKRRATDRAVLGLLVVALISACSAPAVSPPADTGEASRSPETSSDRISANPSQVPCPSLAFPEPRESLPSDLDDSLRAAIAGRAENGLRRDLEWVRRVAADRTATTEFGFPLLPAESESLFARNGRSFMVETLLGEHAQGPDLGGVYMDNALGGVVVVLWTSDSSAIDAEIRPRLPPCFGLLFRQVRWSEAELRRWQAKIAADWDWLSEIRAAPRGVGADISENVVSLEISSANPAAEDLIHAHYNAPAGMIRVESDGTGAALVPWGNVVGRVVTFDGQPVGANAFMLDFGSPDDPPGECGGGDVGFGVGVDGRFEYPCQIGRRTLTLANWMSDEIRPVVASVVVEVKANKNTEVTIRLPEGFDPLGAP